MSSETTQSAAQVRAERVVLLRRRVMGATFGSLLIPGLGQWRCGQRIAGAVLGVATISCAAAIFLHLMWGLSVFESPLGSFLFGVLLRAVAIIYIVGCVDAYFTSLDPSDNQGIRRRQAAALNLLLPGAGYLRIRAWGRALTGLLVLSMIVLFASTRHHRFIDIIFLGAQLIMAAAVYQHIRITEAEAAEAGSQLYTPPLDPVAPAQIATLIIAVVMVLGAGYVVKLRMPNYSFASVAEDRILIRPSSAGIKLRVPDLQLSLIAWGDGWIAQKPQGATLFSAQHERNVTLRVGTELIQPFVREDRYIEQLRRRMVSAGYTHKKTKTLALGGTRATQLWFSRSLGKSQHVDQWTIAVPRGHYSVLVLIECNRARCREVLPVLEKTRDSLRVGG